MNFQKRNKSIVDFLFILALFCAFIVSALFIVLFGAQTYKRSVEDMNTNFTSRTAIAYLTEKIHSNDCSDGGIDIRTNNGQTVLVLNTHTKDIDYSTYLFIYDGYLTEFTCRSEMDFQYNMGAKIIAVSDFSVRKESDRLYEFHITDAEKNEMDFYVSLYSEAHGKGEGL